MYKLISDYENTKKLQESIEEILGQTKLLSMATASMHCEPWINTAYFGYDTNLTLYIITYTDSTHIKNLEENNQIAINIVDTSQNGLLKQGLQLAGMCSRVTSSDEEHALRIWGERIKGADKVDGFMKEYKTWTSKAYKIVIDYAKVFDETRFGEETWVTCTVER